MATVTTSKTFISDQLVIIANNTPGGSGGVYDWLEGSCDKIVLAAVAASPVSNPLDRLHRPEDPGGTYKASWRVTRRVGSNQHQLRRFIGNAAAHAQYVEYGRERMIIRNPSRDKGFFYSSTAYPEPSWRWRMGPFAGKFIVSTMTKRVLAADTKYRGTWESWKSRTVQLFKANG
jgi:hypothetical protein